jgi:hypothetical protein
VETESNRLLEKLQMTRPYSTIPPRRQQGCCYAECQRKATSPFPQAGVQLAVHAGSMKNQQHNAKDGVLRRFNAWLLVASGRPPVCSSPPREAAVLPLDKRHFRSLSRRPRRGTVHSFRVPHVPGGLDIFPELGGTNRSTEVSATGARVGMKYKTELETREKR